MTLVWGIGFILLCCAVLPLVEWLDNRKHKNRRVPRPNWRSARSGRESW
jgi:hypothetical protein